MKASIIIRTYNEQRYLGQLLQAISEQVFQNLETEVILVDSGSNDHTLEIAKENRCRIITIDRNEFSFGRSLNLGCKHSTGDYLIFISGHCIPTSKDWLSQLIMPLINGLACYSYGRQLGGETSHLSEGQVFKKYFPSHSHIPQNGFFCNNANAALLRSTWLKERFNETLTGLEDMELAKRLVQTGEKIAYVAEAPVLHLHHENWSMVKRRYEREAVALQLIMPEVQVGMRDLFRYFLSGIFLDMGAALERKILFKNFSSILLFRWMQYWGTYRGNHRHRQLSKEIKDHYFYPRNVNTIGKEIDEKDSTRLAYSRPAPIKS